MGSLFSNLLIPFKNHALEVVHDVLTTSCIVLMAIAAIAALVLVLLQPGNSDGIDALGGSSETFYGKNKGRSIESKLKLWTYICLGILAVLAVLFFILQIDSIWADPDVASAGVALLA